MKLLGHTVGACYFEKNCQTGFQNGNILETFYTSVFTEHFTNISHKVTLSVSKCNILHFCQLNVVDYVPFFSFLFSFSFSSHFSQYNHGDCMSTARLFKRWYFSYHFVKSLFHSKMGSINKMKMEKEKHTLIRTFKLIPSKLHFQRNIIKLLIMIGLLQTKDILPFI